MELDIALDQPGEWLKGEGKDRDIVISSRIRLARNLMNFPFVSRASMDERIKIEQYISSIFHKIKEFEDYLYLKFEEMSPDDLFVLFERHLISREHANNEAGRSLYLKRDESTAIMVNEEDHLRIQMLKSDCELMKLWNKMDELDNILGSHLPYAFHEKFGHLTACPTNVGTGLRVSVMMHLPALRITGQMDKAYQGLVKHNLILRGFYGEGSAALGDFFQLSNQLTLGKTEINIVSTLQCIVPQILKYERELREIMLKNNRKRLLKEIQKSLSILRGSEKLSTEQIINHLSWIRLGIHLHLLDFDIHTINHLFLISQPAHLQKKQGRRLTPEERDTIRASLFKEYLS